MKKLISLLLAVIMVCSTGISAFAINATPTVTPSAVKAGEDVTVDVTVDEAYSGLAILETRLYFNADLFTVKSTASNNSDVTIRKDTKTDENGSYLQIGLSNITPKGGAVAAGETIATVVFTAKEDIASATEAKFATKIAGGGTLTEDIPEGELKEVTIKITPVACEHTETETTYTSKGDGNHTVTVTCKKCGEVISTADEACTGDEEHTTYVSKNDGNHTKTVKCAKCDYVISTADEACTKGEDGKCAHCGYVFPTVGEDEYTITVNVAPSTVNVTFYGDENGKTALAAEKVADKGVVGEYHVYEVTVPEGMYSYRAVDTADNHELGGMTFEAPVSVEIGADGKPIHSEQKMTLVRVNYYTTNENVKAIGDYSIDIYPGKMKEVVTGAQYINSSAKVVTPTLLHAHGNALLYNWRVNLSEELAKDYGVSPTSNATFGENLTAAQNKTFTLAALSDFSVTAPKGATVRFFNQIKNFNVEELPVASTTENEDGTVTSVLRAPGGNLMYRVSMEGKVTKAGYLDTKENKDITVTFGESENPKSTKDTVSNANMINRMEASVMLNVNAQNNLSLGVGETFRLRAYRGAWQIINSDTANIMIEPDFNYKVISGGEHIKMTPAANHCAGNSGTGEQSNWMDIEGVSEGLTILEVTYDAIEIGGSTQYKGIYGATDPKRTGIVIINVGGAENELSMKAVGGTYEWDAEFDTVYSLENTANLNFTATLGEAEPTVQLSTDKGASWKNVAKNSDGTFTASGLVEGNNILKFTANGKTAYQVVRAAKVTYTVTNKTHPDEKQIYVGDTIEIHFVGLYLPMAKFSGIYNPGFGFGNKVRYNNIPDGMEYDKDFTKGGQYSFRGDNKYVVKATSAGDKVFSAGDIYFNMYAHSDCIGEHRTLTDSGVGANFSASETFHSRSVLPDITIKVSEMSNVATKFVVNAANPTIKLLNSSDTEMTPEADGTYMLPLDNYTYDVSAEGYICEHGSFKAASTDVATGKTITVNLRKADETTWDGKTITEITPNADGVYEVRTGAELAWIAAEVNKGTAISKVKLMNDISLGGYNWTPIGTTAKRFGGEFDGNGHIINDLYIKSSKSSPANVALFAATKNGAVIKDLGVKGEIIGRISCAGIVASAQAGTSVLRCFSAVNMTAQANVAGIVSAPAKGVIITDCYNIGNITATGAGRAAGIAGVLGTGNASATVTNCYNVGVITGTKMIGGVMPIKDANKATCENSYYLDTCLVGAENSGFGTAKTESEMKAAAMVALLGASFHADSANINSGYPILAWQYWGETTYTWNEDNSSVTAVHVALNNPNEVEEETVNTVYSVVKAATCDVKGEGKFVATFTKFAAAEKTVEIPAIGHKWGKPTYEWSADHSTLTGKVVCENDNSHVHTEDARVTSKTLKEATCTEKGQVEFTAEFGANIYGLEKQIKTVDTPALEHDWGETEYTWNSNNSEVTAKHTCKRDPNHTETETVKPDYSVVKAATCDVKGEGKYVATFTNTAFEEQEKTVEIPATDHDWAEPTYEWSSDNKTCTAKRVCKNDKAHEQTQSVNTVSKTLKEATCAEKGSVEYTADFGNNNYGFVKQSKTVETAALGHKLEHHDAKAATCVAEGNVEYWECSVCNKFFSDKEGKNELNTVVTDKDTKNHVGETEVKDYKEATCSESGYTGDTYCKSCGKLIAAGKVSPVVPHKFGEWKVTKQPTKNSAGEKVRYCEVCQYEQKIEIPRLSDGDVIHIGIGDSKGEQNPETGAQVPGGIAAIAVVAAAAVIFGKKKRG